MSDRIRSSITYCAVAATAAQVITRAKRHSPGVWLLWGVGFAIFVCTPVALVDPGILALALDPELVALIVLSSVALLRATAVGATLRLLPHRFRRDRGGFTS